MDDDAALLRLLRLTLLSEGYDVAVAQDGLAGLEQLSNQSFDVVVLDLQMPRMDGRSMFLQMRARGWDCPVLILSAYGAEEARMQLHAEAALGKPFSVDALTAQVRAMLPGLQD